VALSLTRRVPPGDRGSPGGPAAQLARRRQRRESLCPDYALVIAFADGLRLSTRHELIGDGMELLATGIHVVNRSEGRFQA